MPRFRAILIIAFIGLSISLAGQQLRHNNLAHDTISLEDVTISVLPFQEKYMEATGGVYILRGEEMNRSFAIESSDLFNSAPGVYMASGALNTNRVVIRGVGSRTPYNSNRIRAYLDDIPLTSGDGISTLEDLDLFSIGSLEVLKGPASALYGSGLGGVIRLNSLYPEQQGFRANIFAELSSFNTRRYGVTSSYKSNRFALTAGVTRSSKEGYRDNSAYSRSNAFINARYFATRHTLSLTLSLTDLYAEIPSSLNETDFNQEPDKAGGSWGIIKGREEYIKLLGGLKVESELSSRLTNRLTLFTTYADPYERRPFNILDEQSFNTGFRETLEYRLKNINFSAGLEYFHEWFSWSIYETLPSSQGLLRSDQNETRRYLNGFGLMQWKAGKKIIIDGSINLNRLGYTLSTNYRSDSTDQSGSYNYDPVLSPRLGFSYAHGRQLWTYAALGHGFSAPSLEETLLPEGSINTSLRPETGWNFELGNRGILYNGSLTYDFTLYTILLNDLLVTERLSEDVFFGINAGKAMNSGLEMLLRGSLYPEKAGKKCNAGFSLGYNLSRNVFTDFVDDGIDYSGKNLPGIPKQEINTLIRGSFKELEIRIHHQYRGEQWLTDANDLSYEGYQLLHLQFSWHLKFSSLPFHLRLNGGLRNVLNTEYASMILINAPAFGGSAPRYYYPGSPRQFLLGLSLHFN